jgi:Protein of unknown function (DUF1360)
MDLLTLGILGLATWRISVMFVREAGPFFIFQRIREVAGIVHDRDGEILSVPDRFLPGLLSCVWCSSVWAGGMWTLLWFFLPGPTILVASAFCLSALAIAFDHLFNPN